MTKLPKLCKTTVTDQLDTDYPVYTDTNILFDRVSVQIQSQNVPEGICKSFHQQRTVTHSASGGDQAFHISHNAEQTQITVSFLLGQLLYENAR